MCGITGYVDFKKPPEPRILKRMLATILYRGPDDTGVYSNRSVALGIQRLSIIDLHTGDQPITNEDRSAVVVFNGEIYNFRSLRKQLLQQGHIFKTKTDTEVLVHLYEVYGTEMAGYLNGMFAFAIWDTHQQALFLARDQVGIKPLYYYCEKNLLVFGSEIKALLAHPQIQKKINPSVLPIYAALGYTTGPETFFTNIYKLLPGTWLRFTKNGIQHKKYWRILFGHENQSLNNNHLLLKAIRLQSLADVPIGVFLSGGIDSSLIAHYLTQIQKHKIQTFSIGFTNNYFSETKYAQIVAKQLGSEHHQEIFHAADILSLNPIIQEKLDEPFSDPALFPTYKLSQFARRFVKVVLSGDGGDELFGGYPTYQGHLYAQLLKYFPSHLVGLITKLLVRLPAADFGQYYPKQQMLLILLQGMQKDTSRRHLNWMQLLFGNTQSLLKPGFQNSLWMEEILARSGHAATGDVQQAQFLDFMTYLPDDLLLKSDRASMYNSLEMRVPFLDISLIRFAFSLASHHHVDWLVIKKILRKIATDKFPPQITHRRKQGFGIPLATWMQKDIRHFMVKELANPLLYEYYDRKQIRNIWKLHLEGKQNHAKQLWSIIMFGGWLRQWLNN